MDVLTYSSGTDFLDNGESCNPDCLVLDIRMPGMTGIELCNKLKTRTHRIPVVFITAHDDDESRKKTLSCGCVAYLRKPFSDEALLTAINRAFCRRPPH